jgi:transcriptional regulator with XRE-family HTH domain
MDKKKDVIRGLESIREVKGWSKYKCSQKLKVDPDTYSRWEREGTIPMFRFLELCKEAGDFRVELVLQDPVVIKLENP